MDKRVLLVVAYNLYDLPSVPSIPTFTPLTVVEAITMASRIMGLKYDEATHKGTYLPFKYPDWTGAYSDVPFILSSTRHRKAAISALVTVFLGLNE